MTKIIAHRGASYLAGRDNTLESFRLAIELGADMVEFDVRSTRDNVLVVFHDSTFADSPISWLTFDKLEKEAEARGFHIPTFEEVLELCHGKIRMDIEIKEEGFESKLVRICQKYLDYKEYTIKSFFEKIVYRVKKLDKNITTGLLLGMRTMNPMRRLSEIFPYGRVLRCRCDFVSPNEWLVRLAFVERMHFHKIPVYVWTVNRKRTMKRYLKMGVDGLITDKPDAALFVRKELGAKRYEKKNKRIHRIYR